MRFRKAQEMSLLLCFGLVLVASSITLAAGAGYHRTVGIPTAKKIKELEDKIFANENDISFRIIGGSLAPPNTYPFFAGLLIDLVDGNASACGSSILTTNRLVTAAHCWGDDIPARVLTVIFESAYLYHGGTRIATDQVITHPLYEPYDAVSQQHDIAMIYLPINVVFNHVSIAPIDLPRGPELGNTFVGERVRAVGFGKVSDQQETVSPILSHVELQVISVAECQREYPYFGLATICTSGAGHVGICQGDSGGPLAIFLEGRPVLIGVAVRVPKKGCELSLPSEFTRITAFYDFITQHL